MVRTGLACSRLGDAAVPRRCVSSTDGLSGIHTAASAVVAYVGLLLRLLFLLATSATLWPRNQSRARLPLPLLRTKRRPRPATLRRILIDMIQLRKQNANISYGLCDWYNGCGPQRGRLEYLPGVSGVCGLYMGVKRN